jgi:hypothetical protein
MNPLSNGGGHGDAEKRREVPALPMEENVSVHSQCGKVERPGSARRASLDEYAEALGRECADKNCADPRHTADGNHRAPRNIIMRCDYLSQDQTG